MIRQAALVLLAALGPAPLLAQGLSYEGGLSLATGTYIFAERTTSWGWGVRDPTEPALFVAHPDAAAGGNSCPDVL